MTAGESARSAARSRRSRAERLLRSAEAYERGARGEEATARALAALPGDQWRVFHDVRWPGRRHANLDHVVVGPSGVFVVDSKSWSGHLSLDGGVLRQGGRRRDSAVAGVVAAALAVAELVPEVEARAVRPVLCFDREQPVFGWVGEVMVCSPDNLATMLSSSPRRLDASAVHAAAVLLHSSLESARGGLPTTQGRAGSARSPRGTRRARRRRQSAVRTVGAIVLGGLLVVGVVRVLPLVADRVEAGARERLVPTTGLGETVTVPGNPLRPELRVSVTDVRPVRTLRPGAGGGTQRRTALAAEVTIRNTGDRPWISGPGTDFALVDAHGSVIDRAPRSVRPRSAPLLPVRLRLAEGESRRGLVVFDAGPDVDVADVRVLVDPGLPRALQWSVD